MAPVPGVTASDTYFARPKLAIGAIFVPIRAFTHLYEQTNLPQFCEAAQGFADWHLRMQRPDGAWLLTIDRFSNPVSEYVGPGDIPNIAISLLRLHRVTKEVRYLAAALKAMEYAMTRQVTPGSSEPFADQENVLWGFWSWDPYYDYTMSGDQSTHFARGIWFMLDYLASIDPDQAEFIILELEETA